MSTSIIQSSGQNLPTAGGEYAGGWGESAHAAPEDTKSFRQAFGRTLAALRRYWWLIVSIFVVGTSVGIAMTRFIKPKYRVDGTLWIATKNNSGGNLGLVQSPGLVATELGWQELAKSFVILDPVVSDLGLYVRPKAERDTSVFKGLLPTDSLVPGRYKLKIGQQPTYELIRINEGEGDDRVVERGSVGDSVGRAVGFLWTPRKEALRNGQTYEFEVVTPREAAAALQQQLVIVMPLTSNLMRMSLDGPNALRMQQTLNSIMRSFVKESQRLKKENLTAVSRTVDEQLKNASETLRDAETSLESFKINAITQPTENVPIMPGVSIQTNPVMSTFFGDKALLEAARRNRVQLERILAEGKTTGKLSIEALRGAPNLLTTGETGKEIAVFINELTTYDAQLRSLRQRFTDEHQRVKAVMDSVRLVETQAIPQAAGRLLNELQSYEGEMEKRVSGTSAELRKIPARTIEEQRRQRAVDVANAIYRDLQARAVAAKLSEQTVMPDISGLDTAVAPLRPSSDTTLGIIAIAVLASLLLGMLVAVLLDRTDSRIRYPDQAVHELGLDIIGTVPRYTAPRSQRMRLEQASQMIESFRSLALSVRSSFPGNSPVQLTVTSPGQGEGKSTVSINLSNALAEGGYRTLLIDGDIRRGQLHEACPPAEQTPGLIEYLAGEATLAEVIKATDLHSNVWIIPCGSRRRQGPELLASARMAQLLREVRSQFDAIVVDSAPLSAGIDAYALGSATGAMLMVLRIGETDRKLAQSKLTTVDRLPVRIIGTVLNDISDNNEFRFYRYLDGYSSPELAPEVGLIGTGTPAETNGKE